MVAYRDYGGASFFLMAYHSPKVMSRGVFSTTTHIIYNLNFTRYARKLVSIFPIYFSIYRSIYKSIRSYILYGHKVNPKKNMN